MTLPKEKLDNKTYEDLVKEAILRIPIYAPEWTDHNIHDPGRTFIELFAWLAEMQMYSLNRITDRSRRKFLKLIGITELRPAKSATVDVTFSLLTGNLTFIDKETIVAASDPVSGEDILFETQQDLMVVDVKLTKILVLPNDKNNQNYFDRSDANKNENVHYYAFRSKPEVDDELYLGFNKDPGKDITLTFYLYGGAGKEEEEFQLFPSGKVQWKYCIGKGNGESDWNNVEEIHDETNHLSKSGKVRINIKDPPMGNAVIEKNDLFWLRCIVIDNNYDIPPKIDQICLNTVPAIQRSKVKEDQFSGSGLPGFCDDIKDVPVLYNMKGEEKIQIIVGTDEWSKVEDFDASEPGDKHYTMDLKTGRVSFGDGIHGKIPPKGENNILVSYRTGGGVRGNVKASAINRVESDPIVEGDLSTKVSVTNHRPASGGDDAETLEEAIQRARMDLKTPYRAVTSQDYEMLAKNTPGVRVARAKALPGYYPSKDSTVPGIVSVIAVPEVQDNNVNPEPSTGFMKTVYEHLDKHRMLTTELYVLRPGYEEISVNATVRIFPRYVGSTVADEVKNKLNDFLHPTSGGPEGAGWPFGRSVYRSEIYKVIDQVKGVDYVKSVSLGYLFSWNDIPGNDNVRLIEFLKKKFGNIWLETATIKKIDDDMTIELFFKNNSLFLRLNDEKTKVNLEIDDVGTDEFIVRTENDKLNIYKNDGIDISIPAHSLVYSGIHLITAEEEGEAVDA